MSDPIVLSYNDSLLRQSDYRLLDPPNWLNDHIIGFCFQYFELDQFNGADFAFVNPDIAQLLKLSSGEELDIFLSPMDARNKELIFLPVNDNADASRAGGGHWSLLLYRRGSKEFYHYDSAGSLNSSSATALARKLSRYLNVEMNLAQTGSPQQVNGYDCGLYVICITEHICKQAVGASREPLSKAVTADSVRRKRAELKRLVEELGTK